MNRFSALVVLVAMLGFPAALAHASDTLRNPTDTKPTPSTTMRNPPTMATPAPSQPTGDRSQAGLTEGGDTRPAKGSDAQSTPSSQDFGPGPLGSRRTPYSNSSGDAGAGSPNLLNPDAANGGLTPAGRSASTPNGGTAESGSKAAPMRANGVRQVE